MRKNLGIALLRDQQGVILDATPILHLHSRRSERHRVDRGADGFVRNLQGWGVWMHGCQCASNLFRRVATFQVARNLPPERRALSQFPQDTRLNSTSRGTLLRRIGAVTTCHQRSANAPRQFRAQPPVTLQLTTQPLMLMAGRTTRLIAIPATRRNRATS